MSESKKGKKTSKETKRKMSEAHKKRYLDESERRKTSMAMKKSWESRRCKS
jgi:hypothetical protein